MSYEHWLFSTAPEENLTSIRSRSYNRTAGNMYPIIFWWRLRVLQWDLVTDTRCDRYLHHNVCGCMKEIWNWMRRGAGNNILFHYTRLRAHRRMTGREKQADSIYYTKPAGCSTIKATMHKCMQTRSSYNNTQSSIKSLHVNVWKSEPIVNIGAIKSLVVRVGCVCEVKAWRESKESCCVNMNIKDELAAAERRKLHVCLKKLTFEITHLRFLQLNTAAVTTATRKATNL